MDDSAARSNRPADGDEPLTERVERFADGSIRARGPMLGDQLHGDWEWWRQDGSRLRTGSFDRGEQVGEWTTYDRAGAPVKTTVMKPRR